MSGVPFCVVKRPYVVWGGDVRSECQEFLRRIDADFYYRLAQNIIESPEQHPIDDDASQARKDISSLTRLLWHHGIETLVMLLGAYMQAPIAVHAYILKCKTEDALTIGRLLCDEKLPDCHRLQGTEFSLLKLVRGIHAHTGWPENDPLIARLTDVLKRLLYDFESEQHRLEYNAIKHGLRASHGAFSLAVGLETEPGVPAPPENMQTLGYSKDASFFNVAKPLENATKDESKLHFRIEKTTVTWSLEKTLCELQLISLLIHNVIAALRVAGGTPAKEVVFNRISNDNSEAFWEAYDSFHTGDIPTASFSLSIDAKALKLPTAEEVFASYAKNE